MRYKYVSILVGLCIIFGGISLLWYQQQPKQQTTQQPIQSPIQRAIKIKRIAFAKLPGWQSAHALSSLRTFQLSCRHFLRMDPKYSVGNTWFGLRAKDWRPACETALTMQADSEIQAKNFFETWFQPMEFSQKQAITGLFTGYYLPAVSGSLTKTEEYNVPIYGLPNNILRLNLNDFDPHLPSRQLFGRLENNRVRPFYSREEIDQGAIADTAPVLAYLRSHIDRLLIEIQGSALLNLPDGKQMNLGYAGQNGLSYTAIGRVLIDRKILPANQVSMQSIRSYLESHPDERDEIIHQNRSFVFFEILNKQGAYGTLGTQLTKGYSLAVDPDWVPLGMPVWLATTYPDPHSNQQHSFHRLMIAQDTGGAIKGTVRGDVYWGNGDDAAAIAGKMKSSGRYWLLVPKS
ncbi:MAG: MltA domain-containing protein [Legionellales bacterium]|nr:MltA domain-containing protein [Legionellales bacterium]